MVQADIELVPLTTTLWDRMGSFYTCGRPVRPTQQMDVGKIFCGSKLGLGHTLGT